MSLIRRTFACLRPYWKRIFIGSFSASLHALMAGLLVWMAGPLLMTLFATADISKSESQNETVVQSKAAGSEISDVGKLDIEERPEADLDFLVRTKNNLKEKVNHLVAGRDRTETLFNFCLLIVMIAVASNLFLYLQGFFMAFVQQSVIRDFRNRLFEKYQKLSLSYFHHQRTGQLMSRVTNDVIVLNETVDLGFNRLVTDSLSVILLSTFLILLSWKLTLLAALVLPLVFGFIYLMGKKLRKYSVRSQEKMADVNSVLEETVSNIRIVKAYA
ncbi:MAG TPA: ABC transporter ATP-binding protein, partial [candidate division Zixibacteria bacterium]|nr:ABC transporter ATP-binding protein [candidate division Zixibacteria bacterium]